MHKNYQDQTFLIFSPLAYLLAYV